MVEAAELLGVEVDDFLIVGLDDKHKVDESILHPSSRLDEYKEGVLSEERDPSLKCDQCNFKTGDKWQLKIHIDAKLLESCMTVVNANISLPTRKILSATSEEPTNHYFHTIGGGSRRMSGAKEKRESRKGSI